MKTTDRSSAETLTTHPKTPDLSCVLTMEGHCLLADWQWGMSCGKRRETVAFVVSDRLDGLQQGLLLLKWASVHIFALYLCFLSLSLSLLLYGLVCLHLWKLPPIGWVESTPHCWALFMIWKWCGSDRTLEVCFSRSTSLVNMSQCLQYKQSMTSETDLSVHIFTVVIVFLDLQITGSQKQGYIVWLS